MLLWERLNQVKRRICLVYDIVTGPEWITRDARMHGCINLGGSFGRLTGKHLHDLPKAPSTTGGQGLDKVWRETVCKIPLFFNLGKTREQ
jgi:hypothetical protein